MATLLDDFNRANENPLANGHWTSIVEQTDSGGLQLTSNAAAKTGSGTTWSESYWGTTFGPDTEVTAKIGSLAAGVDSFALWLRVTNPGLSSMNGYLADFDFQGNALTIYRVVSGAFTSVGTQAISTYSAGDIIGFSAIGTTLTVTRNGTTVKSVTDSGVSSAGKVGLGINNHGSGTLDDFSANTVSTNKAITPATINGTSTLSGSVIAQKHITSGNINATSTLSGSISGKKAVVPANINVTSTISSNVIAFKHVTSGNINATSTINGSVTRRKPIVTATINATSSFSGNVIKDPLIPPSGINATSILSGAFVLKPGNILPANIFATSVIYSVAITKAVVPAGYGIFDTEDGIIP